MSKAILLGVRRQVLNKFQERAVTERGLFIYLRSEFRL